MKEYKETVHADGQVNEPAAAYSASASQETVIPGLSDEILNELLQQEESVRMMIIKKLEESLFHYNANTEPRGMLNRKEDIESTLDKLHVTGGLRRIVGAFPDLSEQEMAQAKEAYLMEKHGL